MKEGIIAFVVVVGISFGLLLLPAMNRKEITVEGNVIDCELYDEYYEITMDNGKSYKIAYSYESKFMDYTNKSKIMIRMYDCNFIYPDGIWDIEQIIKIDSEVD